MQTHYYCYYDDNDDDNDSAVMFIKSASCNKVKGLRVIIWCACLSVSQSCWCIFFKV